MHARNDRDRFSSIDQDNERRREVQAEVDVATRNRLGLADARFRQHVLDIGKAFQAQQFLSEILGRNASAGDLRKSNGGRFRGRLLAKRTRGADEARASGSRKSGKEAASILNFWHRVPSSSAS